jgi:hypothetical protein
VMKLPTLGPVMIAKLCEPRHEAIELDDTEPTFVVRPSPRIAQCLGLIDTTGVSLAVSDLTESLLVRMKSADEWSQVSMGAVGLGLAGRRASATIHAA